MIIILKSGNTKSTCNIYIIENQSTLQHIKRSENAANEEPCKTFFQIFSIQ